MFSYRPEERILFSMDAFGQHIGSVERFDDELGRATAMSVSLFCFILIFTVVQLRIYRAERVSYV